MVDITHYEVYTDRGTGWKLEERFPADQRDAAIKYTREKNTTILPLNSSAKNLTFWITIIRKQ